MWRLPAALRARIAVVTLVGILLIPVSTSSLGGLTHLVTCEEAVEASLVVAPAPEHGEAAVGSAASISADDVSVDDVSIDDVSIDDVGTGGEREDGGDGPTLCGGLDVDLELGEVAADRADVTVAITNRTTVGWRGSVVLDVAGTTIPLSIGAIGAGETARDAVELRIDPNRSYEITATLMLGP